MPTARPAHLMLLLAGLIAALTIRFNTFTPWGTDSAGYIEAGRRWATGELMTPAAFHFWPRFENAGLTVAPLAFRPGAIRGTEVSLYPLGYPLLIAAAIRVGGDLAAYLVTPILAGLLVWSVGAIAGKAAGPWAAVLASLLVAASPVTLVNAVMPMSDVPAAALWTFAWGASLRPGRGATVAAGVAAAMAIMIRPQLGPLAIVPFGLVLTQSAAHTGPGRWAWGQGVCFAGVAASGLALVAWSQAVLYGGALTPGYIAWDSFFNFAHVPINVFIYPKYLVALHSPLILLGLATPLLLIVRRPTGFSDTAGAVIGSALALAVINFAVYLPYMPHDEVSFVRFMLPALAALCILLASGVIAAARLLSGRSRVLAVAAMVPALVVVTTELGFAQFAVDLRDDQRRVAVMGPYLRETLPENAVVLTGLQGGAIAHYTGAEIIRLDLLTADALSATIEGLERRGYRPAFVVDELMEAALYQRLDWRARAEFRSVSSIWYFDLADRRRYQRGDRWPVDVVR